MEVLCVSALTYYSQSNDWSFISQFTTPIELQLDGKTPGERHTASRWLLEDLCSAFNAVLNASLPVSSRPEHHAVLAELDKSLSNVKHKARTGLNGEELALINNHLLLCFVRRLLVECLSDLKCAGIDSFDHFDTAEQQPNLPFSVIALGSLSKYEACPFSDLELIAVTKSEEVLPDSTQASSPVESKSSDLRPGLVFLMQLLQLKLVSLGESPSDKDYECPDGSFRKGLHLDRIGCAVTTGSDLCISDESPIFVML